MLLPSLPSSVSTQLAITLSDAFDRCCRASQAVLIVFWQVDTPNKQTVRLLAPFVLPLNRRSVAFPVETSLELSFVHHRRRSTTVLPHCLRCVFSFFLSFLFLCFHAGPSIVRFVRFHLVPRRSFPTNDNDEPIREMTRLEREQETNKLSMDISEETQVRRRRTPTCPPRDAEAL